MKSTMQNNLVTLRKFLRLNQGEFAEKLGLKNSTISALELGKNPLTEQNIKLICLTFSVNEMWLRDGTGEMFKSEKLPLEHDLLENYRQLPAELQDMSLKYSRDMVAAYRISQAKIPITKEEDPEKGDFPDPDRKRA
ncbi:hypothetical protein FACS1894172_19920 [Spirochaetia bacterium]|nr:hypothetical protein FACS1894172_19920 [Spirochaetia bacterium]